MSDIFGLAGTALAQRLSDTLFGRRNGQLSAAEKQGFAGLVNVSAPVKDIYRFDLLPHDASAQSTYNGTSYTHCGTVTRGDDKYTGTYNVDGNLIITHKSLLVGKFTSFNTRDIPGDPIGPVINDSHNTVAMGLDGAGRLHVFANMHGGLLRYARTVDPVPPGGPVPTNWVASGLIGPYPITDPLELKVTYPRLLRFPNGDLLLYYRDGTSGEGDNYLVDLPNGATVWQNRRMIAAGKATLENFYEFRPVIDHRGWLWIAGTWRPQGGDANTNADVHLMLSKDRGNTWQAVDGSPVAMPLVHSNTNARILSTPATNSGIINQPGMAVNPVTGNPHLFLTLAAPRNDGSGISDREIHHLWHNGTTWKIDQVTFLRNTMGLQNWPTRADGFCSEEGRVLFVYTARQTRKTNVVWMVDVTPNPDGTSGKPVEFMIADVPTGDFEFTHEDDALRDQNIYRSLLSNTNADVSNPGPAYHDLSLWRRQLIGVLSIDLSRIADVASGKVRIPHMRQFASAAVAPGTSIASTPSGASASPAGAGLPAIVVPTGMRHRKLFARLSMRGVVTGGTLYGVISEQQNGGITDTAVLPFTNTGSNATKSTPWVPLTSPPDNNLDTTVSMRVRVPTGQTATLNGATLELAVLDGPVIMP
ncbi:BNR-4 repeat-containing protein [Sphingomonas mucosissima]|uniref:Uncharacterized protein n=1 Tax=Sphingomonas mucosissima TaxID=370959 RepID=A0A245ZRD1_9SPHN|nr:BNR-4 repeat-containing protein [Sphingomonas mucosissima]OWK32305.1 hypothetical protein SPMU_06270 [Sphingomonas mucosissima]